MGLAEGCMHIEPPTQGLDNHSSLSLNTSTDVNKYCRFFQINGMVEGDSVLEGISQHIIIMDHEIQVAMQKNKTRDSNTVLESGRVLARRFP